MSNETPPKISVCMATKNGGRYLSQQLTSILRQMGPGDELVISDDNSTDNTLDIVNSYKDNRIILLNREGPSDPVKNFENALNKANGEIIVLSDQDDIWMPNKLKIVREQLRENLGKVGLMVMNGVFVDHDGNKIFDQTIFEHSRAGKGIMKNIYDNTYRGNCMAFTKELLNIALPFPSNIPMHDMWLGLLAEIYGHVYFMPEITIYNRRHVYNVTPIYFKIDVMNQITRRTILVLAIVGRVINRAILKMQQG